MGNKAAVHTKAKIETPTIGPIATPTVGPIATPQVGEIATPQVGAMMKGGRRHDGDGEGVNYLMNMYGARDGEEENYLMNMYGAHDGGEERDYLQNMQELVNLPVVQNLMAQEQQLQNQPWISGLVLMI